MVSDSSKVSELIKIQKLELLVLAPELHDVGSLPAPLQTLSWHLKTTQEPQGSFAEHTTHLSVRACSAETLAGPQGMPKKLMSKRSDRQEAHANLGHLAKKLLGAKQNRPSQSAKGFRRLPATEIQRKKHAKSMRKASALAALAFAEAPGPI